MLRAAIAAVFVACASAGAVAQDAYPSRTVRIIVASLPGSTTDVVARIVADALKNRWQKAVVVDNVSRGGSIIGAMAAFRSPPDGYTLFVSSPPPVSYNHLIYRGLKYDPTKFEPIALLARVPNVLMTRADFPASSVRELIDHARANPEAVTFASTGIGATAHLSGTLLESVADIKMRHVIYRGAREAMVDIMGGRLDMFFDSAGTALPQYRAGMVKILAVGSTRRMARAGELPTMIEAGVPGFRSQTWFAMVGPPGLPTDIALKINGDLQGILKESQIAQKLEELGAEILGGSPADATKFFAEEAALWSRVIEANGIHLDVE